MDTAKLEEDRSSPSTPRTIGQLARAVGVPTSTVRFIRAAQASGFTHEDIAKLLELRSDDEDPCPEVERILEQRLERVEEQLARLTHVRGVLSESIRWCRAPRREGCCRVIEDLDGRASGAGIEGISGRTPEELAGALFDALRAGLGDARLFVGAKRLLADGRAVQPGELAERLDRSVDDVLASLDRVPGIERDERGDLVGWGLTLRRTSHRMEVDGTELFTWCALDALFFPALLARTALVRSVCAGSGVSIRLTVRPDGLEALEPAQAVVSFVFPEGAAYGSDVRAALCDHVHYFRDPEAASAWLATHAGGAVLPVQEAFEVGRYLSRRILVEAGEA